MKRLVTLFILFPLLFAFINTSKAQDNTIEFSLAEGYEIIIDGTSNVRDWDARVKRVDATFMLSEFDMIDLAKLTSEQFETLEISIPVEDIESDSGRLTKNMQKYLKGDDYPIITFNLSDIESNTDDGNQATLTANGIINAAGVDHETTMTVNATLEGGQFTFSGTQPLKMTDFNIDPPKALFGTIRARDEIDIIYSLTFTN